MAEEDINVYDNPLIKRYASKEMSFVFSPSNKFTTWRKLWTVLAEGEHQLGLEQVTQEQIDELKQHQQVTEEDIRKADEYEKKFRHDVMAHVHAYGERCPKAKPIIHLGATSCYVGDNTDLIQMKQGCELLQQKLLKAITLLRDFSNKYKDLPTMGFTHYQPAQLTTVGKRATLWLQDFLLDFQQVTYQVDNLPFRGVRGTTGTQASFMELFNGDHEKVRGLNNLVTKKMGFTKSLGVTGQTYTRKLDYQVCSAISQIAHSAHKMATDIRLLMNLKEIDEPFEKNQIGSSAMAYKRNPMRCERICSLARFAMSLLENTAHTHANQWFERTLDDSANRRLAIAQLFLTLDGILNVVNNVVDGLHVWPNVIHKHVMEEMPFMATENILMACVKAGGDRQELHEVIRTMSMEAAKGVKEEGKQNDLMERIKQDTEHFGPILDKLDEMLDPKLFTGRSSAQVTEFIEEEVNPLLEQYSELSKNVSSFTLNV
jgi:adenylosuccinate lyase